MKKRRPPHGGNAPGALVLAIIVAILRNAGAPGNIRGRVVLVIAGFVLCFTVIAARLVDVSIIPQAQRGQYTAGIDPTRTARPDIIDRNGVVLATDIETASLHADTRKIIDIDEAIEQVSAALPGIGREALSNKLRKTRGFVWIKRELSPREQAAVHRLGIPGFAFSRETRRVYPNGRLAAHVLGHVNVDNKGTGGMEKFLDRLTAPGKGGDAKVDLPLRLSLDVRVQHSLQEVLSDAMAEHKAHAAMGGVVDLDSGEVLAMASLPDFTPNEPADALKPDNLNRMSAGVFEPGSTMKMMTVAMALDEGVATLSSTYDATRPLVIGKYKIHDFHAQRRVLSVQEIFTHSSNIGAAKMALDVGLVRQKAFLRKLGLLSRMPLELPETGSPLSPRNWSEIHGATIAFGHGISVSPLQLMAAAMPLINQGRAVPFTFRPRSALEAATMAHQVVKPETSAAIRKLMRLNVTEGTARKAAAPGYEVGGKTGTAEKVINGKYSGKRLRTSFLAAFPMSAPRYLLLVMLDEPQRSAETHGYATAGWNAAPAVSRLVKRIAPILGIMPKLDESRTTAAIKRPIN